MAFDLDAFLKELGATGDEEKTLRTALEKPDRMTLLEKNQLRQADYSRAQDKAKADLAKAEGDLKAKIARVDAEAAEWATLSASEKDASLKLRSELEGAQARVLKLTQRVERIASDAGLDPAKALEGIDQVVPPKEPKVDPIDTSRLVGVDQFNSMSEYLFNLSVELPAIAQEHFDLTGERLNTRELRAEIASRAKEKNANLDPRAIWEEKYQIGAKRETKTNESRAAEIKQAEQRGFERARTEAALPIPPSRGVHSPLLRVNGEKHESVMKRPAPETAVRGAAAALATGKYRPQPAGTTQ